MGCGVWALGFGVQGLGFWVYSRGEVGGTSWDGQLSWWNQL